MKYTGSDSDILCGTGPVDTLLLSSCWSDSGGGAGGDETFLLDTPSHHKLEMDSPTDDESSTKATMDALDSLLLTCSPPGTSNPNLAELKPLPPFTGFHVSINGISGHHYHTIATGPQSPHSPHPVSSLVETNNNNSHATNQNTNNLVYKTTNNGGTLYYTVSASAIEQPIVSSSTADSSAIKTESEYVDYSQLLPAVEIEDFAAIIGSAIADTTVQNVTEGLGGDDASGSRDSWMDLGAWIDSACGGTGDGNNDKIISAESLQEFVNSSQFVVSGSPEPNVASSTLQNLLTQNHQHNYQQMQIIKPDTSNNTNYSQQSHMPLLQSRLQNGPPNISNGGMKPEPSYMSECTSPSSTSYLNSEIILAHTTTGSPPGHVVSTTDNTLLMNGRYGTMQQRNGRSAYGQLRPIKPSGLSSPDLLMNGVDSLVTGSGPFHGNFPHTTTATTTNPSKNKNRNRANRNKQHQQQSVVYSDAGGGGMLGKEKPVHRCTICNRGFLNKSNIKVHLRTHTGEKPFRCEVCGKAFRQKAHLIKHQQIHKRVGRD